LRAVELLRIFRPVADTVRADRGNGNQCQSIVEVLWAGLRWH
jgi:hypothetical protein